MSHALSPDPSHAFDSAAKAAARVAAQFAEDVDRDARFPGEAIDAMREQRLLGAMVPRDLGGAGASLAAIASACQILGGACASAGMVFAMHHMNVASAVRHAEAAPWHRSFLAQLARHEWLVASSTSEDGVGGNLRESRCAVEVESDGESFALRKLAPTISFGSHADAFFVTARRTPSAAATDQVLVALHKDDLALTHRGGWDAFGMRGTCTESFALEARGHVDQIFPVPFAEIAGTSMVPDSHILWASVWTGIAADAYRRAHRYAREHAQGGLADAPGCRRLAEALSLLQAMRGRIDSALQSQPGFHAGRSWSVAMEDAANINTLKTFVSSTALRVADHAMMVCGMAGYRNGTPFSLGRHIRDLYSAPLMINNDRIDLNTANLILARRPNQEESK
jgi:acyl-CoA dehydrogenase